MALLLFTFARPLLSSKLRGLALAPEQLAGRGASIASDWFGAGVTSYVADVGGRIEGMYKLIPNQRDLGSHVANASFMVSPDARGNGIGAALGRHCLEEARRAGFKAMQFNFVVSTNTGAVELWKKLGFKIVGTLPGAFRHLTLGYVDAYVMYRVLDEPAQ